MRTIRESGVDHFDVGLCETGGWRISEDVTTMFSIECDCDKEREVNDSSAGAAIKRRTR